MEQAESFSEGLAAAKSNGKWGFIDKSGEWMVRPAFEFAGTFSEGLARVMSAENLTGYINRTGEIVIRPQFREGWDFSEGLAPVWKDDDLCEYIDKTGKVVLKLKDARWGFSDGLTVVGEYPNRVYLDKKGRVVAPYEVGSQF